MHTPIHMRIHIFVDTYVHTCTNPFMHTRTHVRLLSLHQGCDCKNRMAAPGLNALFANHTNCTFSYQNRLNIRWGTSNN